MSGRSKVTIEDISRETGLSRGTISRALNDRPDISEKTKGKVLAACTKLNYVPSQTARSLATGRHYAVVALVSDLTDCATAEFLRGVLIQAEKARYSVHVVELGPTEAMSERIRTLSLERLDGALVGAPLSDESLALLLEVLEERVAVSTHQNSAHGLDVVTVDQVGSGRLVAEHLFRRGGSGVVYLHAPDTLYGDERLEGFRDACRGRGVDPDQAVVMLRPGEMNAVAIRSLLESRSPVLSGVGASDDAIAITAMVALAMLGRCPGVDVTVIGQGNSAIGRKLYPALSTTDLRAMEMGRHAMETLVARLGKTRVGQQEPMRIEPRLEIRATSLA